MQLNRSSMKKIFIFIIINLISICNINAQCWFTQFKKDFETGSADFKKFIDESEDGMGVFSAYMMEVVPTFLKMQFILENLKS